MTVATTCLSAVAAPVGRWAGLLVAAAFLLSALTGNSFAVHVGMTSMTAETVAAGDAVPVSTGAVSAGDHDVKAADTGSAVPSAGSDVQHLMHLVGACLAVLAGALLFLSLRLWRREPAEGYLPQTAPPRLIVPTPRGSWSPPPPSPPTSSPVVRT